MRSLVEAFNRIATLPDWQNFFILTLLLLIIAGIAMVYNVADRQKKSGVLGDLILLVGGIFFLAVVLATAVYGLEKTGRLVAVIVHWGADLAIGR